MDIPAIPSEIEAQSVSYPGEKPRKFVGFYVVGCVNYQFSFGAGIHQTFFAYHIVGPAIMTADNKPLIFPGGTPVLMGFEVGVEVQKEKLGTMRNLLARNDAN
jgi:hypothetical protein